MYSWIKRRISNWTGISFYILTHSSYFVRYAILYAFLTATKQLYECSCPSVCPLHLFRNGHTRKLIWKCLWQNNVHFCFGPNVLMLLLDIIQRSLPLSQVDCSQLYYWILSNMIFNDNTLRISIPGLLPKIYVTWTFPFVSIWPFLTWHY